MKGEVKICSSHSCFPGQSSLRVPRECLLELGAGIKQIKWGKGRSLCPTGEKRMREGRLMQVFCYRTGDEAGGWVL